MREHFAAQSKTAEMEMSQTSFTPGPWQVHANIGRKSELGIVADAAPCIICTMHGGKANEWPTITRANARLIAAAPDLLAALENLVIQSRVSYAGAFCGKQPWADAEKEIHRQNACYAESMALDAIARARGQEAA